MRTSDKRRQAREMADDDIRASIAELVEEQFRLKFRSATETLENPLRLRHIRSDIARFKTVLRERELAQATTARGRPATKSAGATR